MQDIMNESKVLKIFKLIVLPLKLKKRASHERCFFLDKIHINYVIKQKKEKMIWEEYMNQLKTN